MAKWLIIFVSILSYQAHGTYSIGDSATVKSRSIGNSCSGLYHDTEDKREVVARNEKSAGVDLIIHEVGHYDAKKIDSTYPVAEDLFIDWRKLQDPTELKTFCDIHRKDKGVIEWVDVPAGHFLACKFTDTYSDAPNTTYFGWYGSVPMGFIKDEMLAPECTVIEQLESYTSI